MVSERTNLSQHHLDGTAYSTAHQFSCSAEHFLWLAVQKQVACVEVDLLAASVSPADFAIDRNLYLIRMCRDALQRQLDLSKQALITQATLRIDIELAAITTGANGDIAVPAQFTVTLASSTGKTWQGTLERVTLGQL